AHTHPGDQSPFHQHSAFLRRGLALLDAGDPDTVILSFLHDHPELESCNTAQVPDEPPEPSQAVVQLPWRPVWIADTKGNGRWSNCSVVWQRDAEPRGPVWLKRRACR